MTRSRKAGITSGRDWNDGLGFYLVIEQDSDVFILSLSVIRPPHGSMGHRRMPAWRAVSELTEVDRPAIYGAILVADRTEGICHLV